MYKATPPNGLVLFAGDVYDELDNKEKKILLDFEPPRPISTSRYLCDSKFHTQILLDSLNIGEKRIGFIIMDGKGCLIATLEGNLKKIIAKVNVDLPPKHRCGGQSSNRFANIRTEKRHNYLRKAAELARECFIDERDECRVNVSGLIIAGSADLKTELGESNVFDQRLAAKILKYVDVSYGGEAGFNQAIDLAAECLRGVKLIDEKKVLAEFFDLIYRNVGTYAFGADETLAHLESGVVKTLIVWQDLDTFRFTVRQVKVNQGDELRIYYARNVDGLMVEVINREPLVDWLVENHAKFGAKLCLISDKSSEGSQFCKGFGGIGAILRYQLDPLDHAASYDQPLDGENFDDY